MFFGLRPYQQEGAEFLVENAKSGLFFDCGLGKSLTVLAGISHAQLLPALIVAPLRVAKHVWPNEINKWGFPFSHKVIHGRDKAGQLEEKTDLTIINPEGLKYLEDRYWPVVIVDESTYFKNYRSKRWHRLMKLCCRAERIILLTGTPIAGRGHIDLWAQFALLGSANPLGPWTYFCDSHFSFDMFNRPRLRAGHDQIINQQIAPLVLRKSIEEISMPGLVEIDVLIDMPPASVRRYREINLEENSYAPLRCLASGFEYVKHWSGATNTVWLHQNKLDAIAEIQESSGENLLIFACHTAEIDAIAQRFGAAILDGRTNQNDAAMLIQAWNESSLPMMVVQPRAAGHGLNLQAGGHRIVWMSLPDSGEAYQQANARVFRSGQKAKTVFVHKLICEGTIDVAINGLLARKCLNEQNLLAAIKEKTQCSK